MLMHPHDSFVLRGKLSFPINITNEYLSWIAKALIFYSYVFLMLPFGSHIPTLVNCLITSASWIGIVYQGTALNVLYCFFADAVLH